VTALTVLAGCCVAMGFQRRGAFRRRARDRAVLSRRARRWAVGCRCTSRWTVLSRRGDRRTAAAGICVSAAGGKEQERHAQDHDQYEDSFRFHIMIFPFPSSFYWILPKLDLELAERAALPMETSYYTDIKM